MDIRDKTAVVVGGNGFIGRRLCERLVQEGAKEVRSADVAEPAGELPEGVRAMHADITRPSTLGEPLAGADLVIHCAARVTDFGAREEFMRLNHRGAENVFAACLEAGTKRLVFVSTVVTMGYVPRDGANEQDATPEMGFAYGDAKIRAESTARRLHAEKGLPVVIVRPANVYGPGSAVWLIRPFEMATRGLLAVFGDGSGAANHVYVDNLVDGIVLAARVDRALGETYILSDGADTTWHEYMSRINRLAGKGPVRRVPFRLALAAASVMELRYRLTGAEPLFTRNAVRYTTGSGRYSIDKAREELGFEPAVDLDEGMRRSADWLRETGRL